MKNCAELLLSYEAHTLTLAHQLCLSQEIELPCLLPISSAKPRSCLVFRQFGRSIVRRSIYLLSEPMGSLRRSESFCPLHTQLHTYHHPTRCLWPVVALGFSLDAHCSHASSSSDGNDWFYIVEARGRTMEFSSGRSSWQRKRENLLEHGRSSVGFTLPMLRPGRQIRRFYTERSQISKQIRLHPLVVNQNWFRGVAMAERAPWDPLQTDLLFKLYVNIASRQNRGLVFEGCIINSNSHCFSLTMIHLPTRQNITTRMKRRVFHQNRKVRNHALVPATWVQFCFQFSALRWGRCV